MSDHYDYGYCDYHDTYHDDVKQAHQMQEPRQPTSEELDEIFPEQNGEAPQHLKEGRAASTRDGGTSAVKSMLWDEKTTRSVLGEDGYAWFIERVERAIAKCPHSGKAPITCPTCSATAETLIAFTKVYFDTVPPVYRPVTLRALQPYPPPAVPLEKQAEIIAALKANPDKSYAFFGPAGTGKTVLATALYSEMLYRQYTRPHPRWKWFPVRRISAKKMLDQHADYAIRRNDPDWTDLDRTLNAPDVTADKIRAVTKTGTNTVCSLRT